jgi:hypothetical protein
MFFHTGQPLFALMLLRISLSLAYLAVVDAYDLTDTGTVLVI